MFTKDINETIPYFEEMIPYLKAFIEDDFIFALTDREKIIYVKPSEKITANMHMGDSINIGTATYESLKTGNIIAKPVDKKVFGIAMKSIAMPVRDDEDNIIGIISIGKSMERQDEIFNLSKNLYTSLEQIAEGINQVSSGMQETIVSNDQILDSVDAAQNSAKMTDDVLNFIKNVASETNLLGLNATIEAARAGESGRGFSVVADEIRKLSKSSSDSISQINSTIKGIQDIIKSISRNIIQTNALFQNQAATIEEVNASIEEIKGSSDHLQKMASKF